MALIINNIRYNKNWNKALSDSLLTALETIPEPELVPMEIANIKQGDLPLFMQREMLYIDRSNRRHNTRYVGTKSVDTCVVAYFYNDIEHLTIHFDDTVDIDLAQILERFHDKTNLKLMLVGAGFGLEASLGRVVGVLHIIYIATQTLQINIEVTSQKLLNRNISTPSDKQSFLFDVLLNSANIICQQYFNCSLDYDLFSIDRVREFNIPKPGSKQIDIQFLLLMPQIFRLYMDANKGVKAELEEHMKKKFVTKQAFYAAIDAMLSPNGFYALNNLYLKLNNFPKQSLNHFAIDLTTKKLAVISNRITSDYELANYLNLIPSISLNTGYRYVTDDITDEVIPPRLNPGFLDKCVRIQPAVLKRTIDVETFLGTLGLPLYINHLNSFVQFVEKAPDNVIHSMKLRFFQPTELKQSDYVNDIEVTATLQLLEDMTQRSFTAKMRKEPCHIIDAFCRCESPDAAKQMQLSLQALKIQTQYYVDAEKASFVCVPGINVGQKAQRITDAANDISGRQVLRRI